MSVSSCPGICSSVHCDNIRGQQFKYSKITKKKKKVHYITPQHGDQLHLHWPVNLHYLLLISVSTCPGVSSRVHCDNIRGQQFKYSKVTKVKKNVTLYYSSAWGPTPPPLAGKSPLFNVGVNLYLSWNFFQSSLTRSVVTRSVELLVITPRTKAPSSRK